MNNNKNDDNDYFKRLPYPPNSKVWDPNQFWEDWTVTFGPYLASIIFGEILLHVEGKADMVRCGVLPSMGYL